MSCTSYQSGRIGSSPINTHTSSSTCGPTGFTYQWRSETAPFDLIVIVLVAALVFASWASNLMEHDKLTKERDRT